MKIRASWEIEDGYVGKSRPQHTDIEVDDDEWKEMSQDEKDDLVESECNEDFRNNTQIAVTDWEEEN